VLQLRYFVIGCIECREMGASLRYSNRRAAFSHVVVLSGLDNDHRTCVLLQPFQFSLRIFFPRNLPPMDIPQEIRNIFSTPIGKTAARVLSHQHDRHAWEQGLERLRCLLALHL
jgi:hypothetical protein